MPRTPKPSDDEQLEPVPADAPDIEIEPSLFDDEDDRRDDDDDPDAEPVEEIDLEDLSAMEGPDA